MKKTRILAALLSVMMIVCSMPMMASAAPTASELNGIGAVLGAASALPVSGMDFQFANNFDSSMTGVTTPEGADYDSTNGLDLTSVDAELAQASWKYLPANGYEPFDSGAIVFKAKVPSDGKLNVQSYYVDGADTGRRTYTDISATGISCTDATYDFTFVPGTDWVEYMLKQNEDKGYSVYVKADSTDDVWKRVATVASGTGKTSGNTVGISFYSTCTGEYATSHAGAYVQYATVYAASSIPVYDSIEDIMGGSVASAYALDFDRTFDDTAWTRDGILTSPDGVTYSNENGLDMTTLGTAADWKYYAYKAWSPLSVTPPSADTYVPQAVYMKLKGTVNVQINAPDNTGRFFQDFGSNKTIGAGGATATENYGITSDDGWMEYLLVPDATSRSGGFTLYAKGATATNGKWAKALVTSNYRSGGGNGIGLKFYSNGGYVKTVRAYQLAAADADTIPAGATLQYYNDDMTAAPAYQNLADDSVVYENSYASFPSSEELGNLAYKLNYGGIPVGGYAEFRARSNGSSIFGFYDGATGVSMNINKDYGAVTGGNGYMADGSNTWRTYRVVRTDAGYSVYSKVDGDSGWLVSTTNASVASNATPIASFQFNMHQNGTNIGSGQLDYLKIYGPATDEKLILTDGVGTKVLTEGAQIGYGSTLRPIVQAKSGKLLIVSYSGTDMVKAQLVDAEDLTDQQYFAVVGTGVDAVKVFLWDSFESLNRLAPAVTLSI